MQISFLVFLHPLANWIKESTDLAFSERPLVVRQQQIHLPLENRINIMRTRSFILTLVAAVSAFALLATSAEAGDRKKNRRDRDDYGYYQRDRDDDRRARVVRQRNRDDDRRARVVRSGRDYPAPRVRVWIGF
jgi:hypothetical protein